MKVLLLHAPPDYFQLLDKDITPQLISGKQVPGLIHLFVADRSVFEKECKRFYNLQNKIHQ